MQKPKPSKTEESVSTPVQSQDPVVVAMSERKPDPEESVSIHVLIPTEVVNIKETVDMGYRPESHSEQSVDRTMSPKKSVHWNPELVTENSYSSVSHRDGSNTYVTSSPTTASSFNFKDTVSNVTGVLGRWGIKVGEATKKAEVLAGNTWQHLKTSPSITEAALGRIAQGTKVIAEGGHDKIFRQSFETVPEEKLHNSYACYLSTSAGPVMGVLYASSAKLAFCSDNPLSYKSGDQTEWSYYKVVIPLHQIKAVNPSTSGLNPAEKFIQVISVDNHEFWFMGFLNYEGAVGCLQEASHAHNTQLV